jgi:hypothetical protein
VRRGPAVGLALGGVLVLSACTSEPVLLDAADLPGAEVVEQNRWAGGAPGWTWCADLAPNLYTDSGAVSSGVSFGDAGEAGAVIIDRSADGATAQYFLDRLEAAAAACADSEAVDRGFAIAPLGGLDDGEVGWRTETPDGEWGDYVLIPLDEMRLLAVGFSTFAGEAPVDLDELVTQARQGAQQFLPEG